MNIIDHDFIRATECQGSNPVAGNQIRGLFEHSEGHVFILAAKRWRRHSEGTRTRAERKRYDIPVQAKIDVLGNVVFPVLVMQHLVSRSSSSCGSERAGHSTASSRSPGFCRCATRVFRSALLWRQLEAWQARSALHAIRRQGGPQVCPTNGPPPPSSAYRHRLFLLLISLFFFHPFFPPFFPCISTYIDRSSSRPLFRRVFRSLSPCLSFHFVADFPASFCARTVPMLPGHTA